MHIGLIGAGRMGRMHAATLASHPDVDRLTVFDADGSVVAELEASIGAEPSVSAEELVASGVDAIVIASATSTHVELIELAAKAGRPVFCEKPISTTLATTEAVLATVDRAGTELQVGYMRRFDPGFREARDLVAGGEMGRLLMVRSTSFDHEPPPPGYLAMSGGMHVDLMVHDFDVARWLTGREVAEVYATGAVLTDDEFAAHGDVDTAVVVLRMDDDTPVVITATRVDPLGYDYRLEVLGTADSVAVGLDARVPLRPIGPDALSPGGRPYEGFIERWPAAYQAEMEAFLALVAGGGENPCPGVNDRQALAIAQAADRSRRARRPVPVEESSR